MSPLPTNSGPSSPLLSADGQQRRAAIRAECSAHLPAIRAGVRRRRWLVRSGAAAGLVAGLLALQVWFASDTARTAAMPAKPVVHPHELNEMTAPIPAPALAARPAEPPRPQPTVKIESINDDQLVELLKSAGRPSAVGRIGGKLVVLPQTVALPRHGSLSP